MVRSREFAKRFWPGLVVATVLVALSLANWAERGRFGVPEDGVMWGDSEAGVAASRVEPESPGALVGVRPGDILLSIGGQDVREALDVARILATVGSWSRTEYRIERGGGERTFSVVTGESGGRSAIAGFLLVLGWAYAGIGLWAWARCPPGPATTRFFAFCMASLGVYSLSFSGRLEGLDRLVYWVDVWALLLMAPLFLDFCLRFPDGAARWRGLSRASYALAVAVGAAHHAAAGGWVQGGIGDEALLRFFDSAPLALLAVHLATAGIAVRSHARMSGNPLHRLQSKWLLGGTAAAIVPFAALYVLPFLAGTAPGPNQAFSVLSLAALPVAISTALVRYRLLNFRFVRKKAAAGAAAAALLLSLGYAGLFGGAVPAVWLERYGPLLWLGSLAVGGGLFGPLYRWIESAMERRTYRDRYEDRRTLATFANELATETDLERMVAAVARRLAGALDASPVAILARPGGARRHDQPYKLLHVHGTSSAQPGDSLDLREVAELAEGADGPALLADAAPESVSQLGCVHFVPCRLHGERLAWIALGTTRGGDLLDRDDLSLVEAVAAPFAIALENARLYASLRSKAAEYERLKDYNENIVESLSVGILVLDADDRVLSWNTHLELALHVSRDDARGRKLGDLLPASLVSEIEGCSEGDGAGSIHKYRLRAGEFPVAFRPADSGEGSERIVNVAIAPLVDKSIRKVGTLLVLDDVTERIELEERVLQADKLSSVGLLAAGVAHEVNTPLAVISSYSQMLASQFAQGSAEASMLGKVTEQTFRASEIVNSLLDFSRTANVEMAPCDLDRAVADTLDLIRPQLRQAGIAVETDFCEHATVLASNGKLQQVFLNLFLNARDAMPDGGTLRISSRTADGASGDGSVEVSVSDTGTGIAPEDRRHVFDPFFTTKGPRKGTGLGLAVSYGIVREHAGTISVESDPGTGATFLLRLPLAARAVHA